MNDDERAAAEADRLAHDAEHAAQAAHTAEQDREIAGAVHAIDAMGHVVDRFEQYVYKTSERDANSTVYRLNLLWVHAVAALLMAPLIVYTGPEGLTGPSFAFLRQLPYSPFSLASILGGGGLILGLGCVFRHKVTEMVGLAMLAVFYITVGVSFAVPPIRWFCNAVPGEPKPPFYAPVLYAHMFVIMAAHVRGLIFARRDKRAIAAIPHTPAAPAEERPTP